MAVLITGGAGFIGSHLCEAILARELRDVICLDNFNSFYDPSIKRHNISGLISSPHFTLVEGDIRDQALCNNIFETHSIDVVIHLAAMAGVRPSIENAALYYDVNVHGTLTLLECSKTHGVETFLFASSSSVYGNNKKSPFSESDFVDHPVSPYAASKKAGELLAYTYD